MEVTQTQVRQILTRACGYLFDVASHSLQPYRGCGLGNSLCGVACYVRHNWYVTRGRRWGSFLEVRTNAAASYIEHYTRERAWARRKAGRFGIFLSSSTEPFQPIERKAGITRSLLQAMVDRRPDLLILQTHLPAVTRYIDLYRELARRCELRVHVSIESDRDTLPGLPKPASPVRARMQACAELRQAGLRVVATVAPLLPIDEPHRFFAELSRVADAVVIDHFIGGDGTPTGARTRRTPLPLAMQEVHPYSTSLAYRDEMVAIARTYCPGRTGVGIDGFAGRYT